MFAVEADGEESVSATEGYSVTLSTGVTFKHPNDLIQWEKFGPNKSCSATVDSQFNTNIYDGKCNETFKDRLQFDRQTGSLTFMNIRTTDTGLYQLKVIFNNTTTKTFNVSVTGE